MLLEVDGAGRRLSGRRLSEPPFVLAAPLPVVVPTVGIRPRGVAFLQVIMPGRAFLVASVACILMISGLVATYVFTDVFTQARGSLRTGGLARQRACLGVTVDKSEHMRHAFHERCVGVPYGPWRCFRMAESGRYYRVGCPAPR